MEADRLVRTEADGTTASGNMLDHLLAACKGLFRERRQAVISLASSESSGATASDDVLDNLLAACKDKFLEERHQAAVNLQRAEQERDEARAELKAAMLRSETINPQHDSYGGLQNSMVVCLIDADGAIPVSDRLRQGFQGGQQAAKDLRDHLLNYIEKQGLSRTNTVIVSAYCNRNGLRNTLVKGKQCDDAQFMQFWNGFQSTDLFCLIDVGPKKEAADAKIHAAMLLYARMPQVSRLFLGVAHDGGYHHPLSTLILEGHREKVVLLRSFDEDLPIDLHDLRLEQSQLDGLFMENKLPKHTPRRSGNRSLPSTPNLKSNSLATESPNRIAAQDAKIPPQDHGIESSAIGLGLVLPDNDVPLRTSAVESRSTSVGTPPQGQSLLFESHGSS